MAAAVSCKLGRRQGGDGPGPERKPAGAVMCVEACFSGQHMTEHGAALLQPPFKQRRLGGGGSRRGRAPLERRAAVGPWTGLLAPQPGRA